MSNTILDCEGNNTLIGYLADNPIYGGTGDQSWLGGLGAEALYGEEGDDHIEDRPNSGFVRDTLESGEGKDKLAGDFDADHFVLAGGHGVDGILDCDALNSFGKIDLSAVSSINALSDLAVEAAGTGAATEIGDDVRIATGAAV